MFWNFFKSDPWYTNAIVYQIYPWSFKDSNNDGIGDLGGIIQKLDYLNDGTPNSLGVTAIWISPIYPSPMKDFGYDVSDYCDIDPRFGTLEIFDQLIAEAHKRNIKIILDLVTNHTSSEHDWFKESRESKINPKRDWYVWRDPKPDGSPPNNWLSISGGPAWTRDPATGQYYLHNFLADQPDLNWRNPSVKAEMKKIIGFWLKRGVDGFRVDAMSQYIEDEQLRDDPVNPLYLPEKDTPYQMFLHTFSSNRPETLEVITFLCSAARSFNKKSFIVTESYLKLPELGNVYQAVSFENYAPFNFNFLDMEWSAKEYRSFIDSFDRAAGPTRVPTYVIGNHDQKRAVTRLGKDKAKLSAMLLLTLRGMPFIYYGEELGMKDATLSPDQYRDGFAVISNVPTISRDPARTPMQWTAGLHAGFSEVEPWLPLPPDYKIYNTETEQKDSCSFLNLYKTLIQIKRTIPAFHTGIYQSFNTASPHVLLFSRSNKRETYFVLLNFSNETVTEKTQADAIKIVCTTYMDINDQMVVGSELKLRPYEGIIFRLKSDSD